MIPTVTVIVLFPYFTTLFTAARSGPSETTEMSVNLMGVAFSRWWISTSGMCMYLNT